MKEKPEEVYYGYRVIPYMSVVLTGIGVAGIALGITFTVLAYSVWILILCWVLGVIFLGFGVFWQVTMGFVANSKKAESLGNNYLDRLATIWDGEGKVLDIGTGRGRMAIEIAKRFPKAQVIGMDLWKKMWSLFGQTKSGAEKNASAAKVDDRCTFQYGNALELPFKDGEFQLVVSCFVFHEVQAPDKMILFKEIARVLAPGGTFMIFDFFSGSFLKAYKAASTEELLGKMQQLGIKDVKHEPLKEAHVYLGSFYRYFWESDFLSGKKAVS